MRPHLTLHHPARARRYYADGHWTEDTFYSLLVSHARERGNAPALRDGRRCLSWAQLLAEVDTLAADLHARGLGGGDRVSLWLSNRLEGVVAFLACARQGIGCNPSLHRTFTCGEIGELLERLQARALITEPGWGADRDRVSLETVLAALPGGLAPEHLDRMPAGVSGAASADADADTIPAAADASDLGFDSPGRLILLDADALAGTGATASPADLPPACDDPDVVAYLAFTSGTTGMPKCVMHSANTLLANGRDLARDWGLTADARTLSLSPLSHHIFWVGVAQWLFTGCEFITDDPPKGTSRLDWLLEVGATYVLGVPTHAVDILAEQRKRGLARLGDVKVFYMAGSPIPPVVAEAFTAQGIKPQNVYGMTENSSHQYTHPDDPMRVATSTCGRGGRAYTAKVFDADNPDIELGPGQTGQIGGQGAALMLGYFDDQAATAGSFNRDGWFLSGDLGSLDAEGNLTIEGRSKDLIIRGGHNIHPSRIEALALRHGSIAKAAAFGVADERLGEKVCLAIIGELSAAEVLAHLDREGLSRYDMPEYFLAVQEFPLTASGKILKRELVAQVKAGTLSPEPVRCSGAS